MQTKFHWLFLLNRQSLLVWFISSLLFTGCAGSPEQKAKPQVAPKKAQVAPEISPQTAEDYLSLAQKSPENDASIHLLTAANLYATTGQAEKSLWLANKLAQLPLSDQQLYQVYLLRAQLLLADSSPEIQTEAQAEAQAQLAQANKLVNNQELLSHSAKYYQLASQLYDLQAGNEIAASQAALLEFSRLTQTSNSASDNVDNNADIEQQGLTKISQLWHRLSALSSWQLSALKRQNLPFFDGWYKLISYVQQYSHHPSRLARYLDQWQRQFPTHPGQAIISTLAAELTREHPTVNNIAVLLPLSGKAQPIAKVLQEGILAAYKHKSGQKLHFYDANSLDYPTLANTFTSDEIDFVIGPLLKENVTSYLSQAELVPPTLLLNVPEQAINQPHIVAFSMKPEDEAIQAATTLSQYHYQAPLVIAHNDATSKRIANAFIQQWQQITHISPEVSYFDQGKDMQNQVKASLDVNYSQLRIRALRHTIKPELKLQSRNRRDIDMIYAIGDPIQIKLLKPYIDVNVSPFADVVPVFANSRSHSAKTTEATSRDLSGLVFAEMPWLLTSKQQNKPLARLAHSLWPTRSDSFQLFFAMGYDSYQLIKQLPRMQQSPYLRHFGQTGTLKLTNNVVTRSLLWGQYINNKEKQLVLE